SLVLILSPSVTIWHCAPSECFSLSLHDALPISAHGDREYGFIGTRLEIGRKVIVGFWKDEAVIGQIGKWMKTAIAVKEGTNIRVDRKSTRLNSSHVSSSYAVFCLKKKRWQSTGT